MFQTFDIENLFFFIHNQVMEKKTRECGVLLHPVSLPSHWGIGDIGENAFRFVDKLKNAGVRLWQVLPLGPTGFGDSPYAARSTFAGNELLISMESLYENGYLELVDILNVHLDTDRVDYGQVKELKMPLLRKAAQTFLAKPPKEYRKFCNAKAWWLDDYALYQVLCAYYNDSRWFSQWPEELKVRDKTALDKARNEFLALFAFSYGIYERNC